MHTLQIFDSLPKNATLLCIGAHSDDIEIGCGGTILALLRRRPDLNMHWVVLSAAGLRGKEAGDSAADFLASAAKSSIILKSFRNGFFPYVGADIKEFFESLKDLPDPALIMTHYREDRHQDHRTVSDLTWNTFRNHLILEYEIPKYDGDIGRPSAYVALENEDVDAKIRFLNTHFASQRDKQWFTDETFRSLARLRGIECNASSGLAEAFYARKLRLL